MLVHRVVTERRASVTLRQKVRTDTVRVIDERFPSLGLVGLCIGEVLGVVDTKVIELARPQSLGFAVVLETQFLENETDDRLRTRHPTRHFCEGATAIQDVLIRITGTLFENDPCLQAGVVEKPELQGE
jgi:hypothetical protein